MNWMERKLQHTPLPGPLPKPLQALAACLGSHMALQNLQKLRFFNHNQLRPLSLPIPFSLSNFPSCWVMLQWPWEFWASNWEELELGLVWVSWNESMSHTHFQNNWVTANHFCVGMESRKSPTTQVSTLPVPWPNMQGRRLIHSINLLHKPSNVWGVVEKQVSKCTEPGANLWKILPIIKHIKL